jgi:hypothetical protein
MLQNIVLKTPAMPVYFNYSWSTLSEKIPRLVTFPKTYRFVVHSARISVPEKLHWQVLPDIVFRVQCRVQVANCDNFQEQGFYVAGKMSYSKFSQG